MSGPAAAFSVSAWGRLALKEWQRNVVCLLIIVGGLCYLWANNNATPVNGREEKRREEKTVSLPLITEHEMLLPLVPPLIGTVGRFEIPFHPSISCSADIAKTEVSCGCAQVISHPSSCAAWETSPIVVDVQSSPFDLNARLFVSVYTDESKDRAYTFVLNPSPVSPFTGWPQSAQGHRQGNNWEVHLASPYGGSGAIADVRAFVRGSTVSLPARVTPSAIVIEDADCNEIDLLITFGSDRQATWSGPLILSSL